MMFEELIAKLRSTCPCSRTSIHLETAIRLIITELSDFDSDERCAVLYGLMMLAILGVSATECTSPEKVMRVVEVQGMFRKEIQQQEVEMN